MSEYPGRDEVALSALDELIEKAAKVALARQHGVADYEPNPWEMAPFRALADAGLLADPEQRAELELARVLLSFAAGDGSQPYYPGTPAFAAWQKTEAERDALQARVTKLEEQVAVGHRVQLVIAGQWLGHAADKLGDGPGPEYLQRLAEWLTNGAEGDEPEPRAALQGADPTP